MTMSSFHIYQHITPNHGITHFPKIFSYHASCYDFNFIPCHTKSSKHKIYYYIILSLPCTFPLVNFITQNPKLYIWINLFHKTTKIRSLQLMLSKLNSILKSFMTYVCFILKGVLFVDAPIHLYHQTHGVWLVF